MTLVLLTPLVTCKSIGAPQGWKAGRYLRPWPLSLHESREQLHSYSPSLAQSISLSLPFAAHFKVETRLEKHKKKKKHNDLTIDFLFPYHLRLLPFAIRQDPNDFHSLSPPLPSSSRLRHPAILPALLHFFSVAFFPFSFFCCVLLALNWNSALWNGKVIYIDSSGLFGCRSYPEPLVMLLETWQQ